MREKGEIVDLLMLVSNIFSPKEGRNNFHLVAFIDTIQMLFESLFYIKHCAKHWEIRGKGQLLSLNCCLLEENKNVDK